MAWSSQRNCNLFMYVACVFRVKFVTFKVEYFLQNYRRFCRNLIFSELEYKFELFMCSWVQELRNSSLSSCSSSSSGATAQSDVFRSHTMAHHSLLDSSGRGIGQSQRPLFDNTQHSQQTDFHASGEIRTSIVLALPFFVLYCTTQTSLTPAGFKRATPASNRPQTLTLDRSATGICNLRKTVTKCE